MGEAGAADLAEAGEFRLGRDRAGAEEFVEVDGERKKRGSRSIRRFGPLPPF